jgi:ATP-dependent RNA helicase DeaD
MELPSCRPSTTCASPFKDQITETLAQGGLEMFQSLVEDYEREHDVPARKSPPRWPSWHAATSPLLLEKSRLARGWPQAEPFNSDAPARARRPGFEVIASAAAFAANANAGLAQEGTPPRSGARHGTYRIEVGHQHGVKPGNIVGAIANEGGVDGEAHRPHRDL